MSKIGKQQIKIPEGVMISISDSKVSVKGPKGELSREFLPVIEIKISDNFAEVSLKESKKELSKFWGLSRALLANMVEGVVAGFHKELELKGVGYKAQIKGDTIEVSAGYSNPVSVKAPSGIEFEVNKNSVIVKGIDKEMVGQVAAKIRAIRLPEPYKGSGIRYKDELVRRKAGKKAVGTA